MAPIERDAGAQGAVEGSRDPSGVPVVELIGEIDISNAERLSATLDRLIDGETTPLVVDLAKLEFMDSSGIAMLLKVAARVDSIEIRNPSNVVRRIIECTGLTDVLHLGP
jgi:anti-sigma B factor antagonist